MIKIFNFQLSIFNLERGQTLLEVIVGLGVGVAVLVAITSAVLSSLTGSNFGKNQTQATLYAQQGMEVVRDLRNREGNGFFSRSGTSCMGTTNSLTPGPCSTPNLENFFTRRADFNSLGAGRMRVNVTVSFADSKGSHQSNLVSIFTDWNTISAPTSVVTLSSLADSYVGGEWPASNFGVFSNLNVMSYLGWSRRTFISFDLSSIPAGSTIISATLSLYNYEVTSSQRIYNVHRVSGSWTETGLTWSNQPGVLGAPTSSATTPATAGWMSWNATSDVQAWIGGASNFGFRINDAAEGNAAPMLSRFYSKEWASSAVRPKLEVSFVQP